jgi:hypothetical protein
VSGKTFLLLVLLLAQASCYRASFYTDPKLVRGLEHDTWSDFFIFGLVGNESFDVQGFCVDKPVAEVKTGGNFATSFVSWITLGIYTPRKIYVTCAAGPGTRRYSSQQLQLDIDRGGMPVRAVIASEGKTQVARITPVGPDSYRVRYQVGGAE